MESKQGVKSKHKKRFKVIMEIVFMALGILCGIMPQPFPLLVPIIIGTIRIISNAVKKELEPATPVVYCNGHKAPDKLKKEQKQNVRQAKKTRPESTGAGGK